MLKTFLNNIKFLEKGGWVMFPIILCSIFSLAIIIERFLFFVSQNKSKSAVILKIFDLVKTNKIAQAIQVCENNPSVFTNIIKAGLLHYDYTKTAVKDAMETTALYEIPKFERNLNFLNTLAHITPLLGLLGTVTGLVKCFYTIEKKSLSAGIVNPADLAGGIWEALLTTVGGLCVAIPTYIAYNYFVHKVNLFTLEAERYGSELLEIHSQQKYKENFHDED